MNAVNCKLFDVDTFEGVEAVAESFPGYLEEEWPGAVNLSCAKFDVMKNLGIIMISNALQPDFVAGMASETKIEDFVRLGSTDQQSWLGNAYLNSAADSARSAYARAFRRSMQHLNGSGITRVFTNLMQPGNNNMEPHVDNLLSSPSVLTADADNGELLIDPDQSSDGSDFHEKLLRGQINRIPYGPSDIIVLQGMSYWHKGSVNTGKTRKTFAAQRI